MKQFIRFLLGTTARGNQIDTTGEEDIDPGAGTMDDKEALKQLTDEAMPLYRKVIDLKNRARAAGYDMEPAITVRATLFEDDQLVFEGFHVTRVFTVKAKP